MMGGMQLSVPQKRLGARGFMTCALAMYTMSILAIDMYTPALPGLTRELSVSASVLNLTMFSFFLMSAFGVFVAGPVSDRFGRRPVLIAAGILFALGSAICALANGVPALVGGRVLEAMGYGAIAAADTALVKDAFEGDDLKLAMTLLQSLIVVGPVVAPFLGTFVLSIAGWRTVFWLLTVMGVACTASALLVSETLAPEHRLQGTVGHSLGQSVRTFRLLLKGRRFSTLAVVMALAGLPYAAFLAVVPYILLDGFQTGYLEYSFIYAVVSLMSVISPFVYMRMSNSMSTNKMLAFSLAACIASSAMMVTIGRWTPVLFCISVLPFILAEGVIRPMSFVVLLDQPPERVGSASSLTNLMYNVLGSVGTVFVTFGWTDFLLGLGVTTIATTVVMIAVSIAFVRAKE